MSRLILVLILLFPAVVLADDEVQRVYQLIDYIGVDYKGAVQGGVVINDEEYHEMVEFSGAVRARLATLEDSPERAQLEAQALLLEQAVMQKQDLGQVEDKVADLRSGLLRNYQVVTVPAGLPDMRQAAVLYSANCASCHGEQGMGDGPYGMSLEPAPTNFHDSERASQRSLYGLYSTITLGVDDTGMQAFTNLSEQQRWALAFYVGQMASGKDDLQAGAALFAAVSTSSMQLSLHDITTLSPAEAASRYGDEGRKLLVYLRSQPGALFASHVARLAYAREALTHSIHAYRQGNIEEAGQQALLAYLEGFELVEGPLATVAPKLQARIEHGMNEFRVQLREGAGIDELEQQYVHLQDLLQQANDRLSENKLSAGAAFSSAALILLREGLEAILVIAALGAFLIKSGRAEGMRYLHAGWIAALLAGGTTWWVSVSLIEISGAERELTEAVAAIVAAVLLFYVGFWMHSKTNAMRWKQFIEQSIHKALSTSTLWSLALLSFIAVYREAFETILFYQSLWVQADVTAQSMITSGFISGSMALLVLAWLIMRYSVRLPLRQFFLASGMLMFVLAVIFAGKGVAALMEAGWLPLAPIDIPTISLLGIYPNLTGLLVQSLMVLLALVLLLRGGGRKVVEATE